MRKGLNLILSTLLLVGISCKKEKEKVPKVFQLIYDASGCKECLLKYRTPTGEIKDSLYKISFNSYTDSMMIQSGFEAYISVENYDTIGKTGWVAIRAEGQSGSYFILKENFNPSVRKIDTVWTAPW